MNFTKGIKVFVSEEILKISPKCAHGPTVAFERTTSDGTKTFYACCANRDRKLCSFYQLISEDGMPVKHKMSTISHLQERNRNNDEDFGNFREIWQQFEKLPFAKRKFCRTCSEPIMNIKTNSLGHENHTIIERVGNEMLSQPTLLLEPLTDNKGCAQYYFDKKTKEIISNVIDLMGFTHILCIGTPSLHEHLTNIKRKSCFLLDVDQRLVRMLPPESTARYNMFNHHFFDQSEGRAAYLKFLSSGRDLDNTGSKFMIVVDPPFGGMVELIMFTLATISKEFFGSSHNDQSLQSFIALPYFLEDKICDNSFRMLDLEVTYMNHSKLKKRKRSDDESSIVKIFTNIHLHKVLLPVQLGYRFCNYCEKYVCPANKHCAKCKSCTTKVGKTYRHCKLCRRCVKPSWRHCEECGVCELPGRHSKIGKKYEDSCR